LAGQVDFWEDLPGFIFILIHFGRFPFSAFSPGELPLFALFFPFIQINSIISGGGKRNLKYGGFNGAAQRRSVTSPILFLTSPGKILGISLSLPIKKAFSAGIMERPHKKSIQKQYFSGKST